jgi:hypothetical protein
VEEFLIKNPLLELDENKKFAVSAIYSAYSSNLKSAHLFCVSVYVLFLTALAFFGFNLFTFSS